MKQLCRFAYFW